MKIGWKEVDRAAKESKRQKASSKSRKRAGKLERTLK